MITPVLRVSLREWFNNIPRDHTMPSKRPIILINESLIQFDNEARRYFFINYNNQKQFGLVVFVNGIKYLLWFLPLRLTLQEIEALIEHRFPIEVKMLSTQRYQEISNDYSQGVFLLKEPLVESV